jgi:hypothetical protein
LEPSRWERVQHVVSVDDFAPGSVNRQLAEIYWDYQRHEGEPVFNEFLGLLANSDPALAEAAVEAVDEAERLSASASDAEAGAGLDSGKAASDWNGGGSGGGHGRARRPANDERPDRDRTLAEAVAHLERLRALREEHKLLAELRRTSDGRRPPGGAPAGGLAASATKNNEADEVVLLKQLQEKARQPDLRRV